MSPASPSPVVAIPSYRNMTEYEAISLRHAKTYLRDYPLFSVSPRSSGVSLPGIPTVTFPQEYFYSRLSYNRLLLSPGFYEAFADYSHVLIYQLDAIVLRDELRYWCDQPYDYIGASWYPELIEDYEGFSWPYAKQGCGNGGLSLRRVAAFSRHLEDRRAPLVEILRGVLKRPMRDTMLLYRYARHLLTDEPQPHESFNEDVYFGVFAPLLDKEFRVAPADVGDRFSFEYAPAALFERTNRRLPFGAHAWCKFSDSLEFWRPYLLCE